MGGFFCRRLSNRAVTCYNSAAGSVWKDHSRKAGPDSHSAVGFLDANINAREQDSSGASEDWP
jgi:hypothetical protein